MLYYVIYGRNGEKWVTTSMAHCKRDAMREAFRAVLQGVDWIDVYTHEEGSFAIF